MYKFRCRLFVITILFFWGNVGFPQKRFFTQIHDQPQFRSYLSDDGLVNNRVIDIAQDSAGFIWIATYSGISRYDGLRFHNYLNNQNKNNTLNHNRTNEIFIDSKKRIWIGNIKETQIYDPELDDFQTFKHKDVPNGIPNVYTMAEDHKGNLWFACSNLYRYNTLKDSITTFTPEQHGIPELQVYRVGLAVDSTIWVGGKEIGAFFYAPEKDTFIPCNQTNVPGFDLTKTNVNPFYVDKKGQLWLGTQNYGAYCLGKDSVWVRHVPDTANSFTYRVRDFFEDEWGHMYFCTRGGVYQKNEDDYRLFASRDHPVSKMNHSSVFCYEEDRTGGAWLGTFAGGISYFNKSTKAFTYIRAAKDDNRFLNDRLVYALQTDKKGNLWIGTEIGGLNYLDLETGRMTYYTHDAKDPSSIGANEVRAIVADSIDNLWIATNRGGLNYFDRKTGTFRIYKSEKNNEHSLWDDQVYELLLDGTQKLWVGTAKGLNLMDLKSGKVERFHIGTKGIARDSQGRIWFGLYEERKGLCCFRTSDSSFVKYYDPNILTTRAMVLHVDKNDVVWFGFEAGFARFDQNTEELSVYNSSMGYPFELVYSIEEDKKGNLWLGTNKGIVNLIGAVNKPEHPIPFKHYKPEDGLQGLEFAPLSSHKDANGKLYFGGINGFNSFYPDQITDNPFDPQIALTELKVLNKKVSIGDTVQGSVILKKAIWRTDHLVLNHKHNLFTLEFCALHFQDPKANEYLYRLDGFENEWIRTTGERNFASYSGLQGGEYTFLLKAANPDGIWSNKILSLKITIVPPWWQTLWFKILVSTLVVVITLSVFYVRVKRLEWQKSVLEERVMERTQKLSQANHYLEKKQEEILRQNEEIFHQKDIVEQKSRETEQAYMEMRTLSEFGQKITSTLRLEEVGQLIYGHVLGLVPVDVFGIALYSANKRQLRYITFIEDGNNLPSFMVEIYDTTSLAAWVMRNEKELYCPNFTEEADKYLSPVKLRTKRMPESVLLLPLTLEQRQVGVLCIESYDKNSYSDKDLTRIRLLASFLAISLDNANAYQTIEIQNNSIRDSITYAKTIQEAILPKRGRLAGKLDSFVFYRPRDIVSGDFYWAIAISEAAGQERGSDKQMFVATVDCTGHGVPGAFMSVIGSRLLNEIVNERRIHGPADILEEMDQGIIKALKQYETRNDDGMEISLLKIWQEPGQQTYRCEFAGAKLPLLFYHKAQQELEIIRGSVRSIGGPKYSMPMKRFVVHQIQPKQGDVLYMVTDGVIDQHNPKRKRFGIKKLTSLLEQIGQQPMSVQKTLLDQAFDNYRLGEQQRDDATLIGIMF